MTAQEWKIVNRDEDGNTYGLFRDGVMVAEVCKGWVRNGGNCWMWAAKSVGFPTLKEAKNYIEKNA